MPQDCDRPMNILVLQHVAVEHPGIFREFFARDGFKWTAVELDEGQAIPVTSGFDLMLVMGGPQDVWQEREHPWLRDEIAAIRNFVVVQQKPFLGICLGHQLLAAAIGGRVAPAVTSEVGIMTIEKTEAGRCDPVLRGLPDPLTVLQWHGAEVASLPDTATVLARSDACAIQAFRYGRHAYGLQCHIEVTSETVADWAAIPIYKSSLDAALGQGAADQLAIQASALQPAFNRDARTLYDNLKAVVRSAARPS